MPRVIHWGLVGMGESSRLKLWGARGGSSVPGRAVFAVLIYVYWMIKNDVNKSSVRIRNNDFGFDLRYIFNVGHLD